MGAKALRRAGLLSPGRASKKQYGFLAVKLHWLNAHWNKKVVCCSGAQASGHYAQGVIYRLVDEATVSTAT